VIAVFSRSEPGGHRHNEDVFAVRSLQHQPDRYLCAVADGQGGQAGGAEAARIACAVCVETALSYSPNQLLNPFIWETILQAADAAVCDSPSAGFTTLVAFCITEAYLCGASCGDSALLLLNANDPALVLTERQEKNPPVGSRAAIFVLFAAKLLSPWMALAMSDGVWKYAGWDRVLQIAKEKQGEGLIDALRDSARMPHSADLQDDFTLVVFQG
jgi:hypothetical protein